MNINLEQYLGMNFKKWCALDIDDTRKINYTIIFSDDDIVHCTSEDTVSWDTMLFVQESIIEHIDLIDNEWFVELRGGHTMNYNVAKEIVDVLIETQMNKESDRNILMDLIMNIEVED